ncbi:MAG: hypothetical protein JWM78_2530 [Verrucomicrobiaceae bacterium]|nr:hypothetical protein [Verrucomicrobiaceae bacterium]
MKITLPTLALLFGLMTANTLCVHAETPYEADQRQQMEAYQRTHGVSAQVQQSQRWEQEWRQQHPNEPVPNAGVLQKLHRQETLNNINQGFAKMRQERQAKLQQDYAFAKQRQQQMLAAQHITWTPQQWQNWDRQYDQSQQAQAQAYLDGIKKAGEIQEAERQQREMQYNMGVAR